MFPNAAGLEQEPVNIAALFADVAICRRIGPVKIEEGSGSCVELGLPVPELIVLTDLTLQLNARNCLLFRLFFAENAHGYPFQMSWHEINA
jgi:hypothetical protein